MGALSAIRSAHVEITQGPALGLAHGDLAIVRWTTNNPGGLDDQFWRFVLRYGSKGPWSDDREALRRVSSTTEPRFRTVPTVLPGFTGTALSASASRRS